MCRFLVKNNLVTPIKKKQWKTVARGYNGANYAQNAYDTKMARANTRWEQFIKLEGGTEKLANQPAISLPDEGIQAGHRPNIRNRCPQDRQSR